MQLKLVYETKPYETVCSSLLDARNEHGVQKIFCSKSVCKGLDLTVQIAAQGIMRPISPVLMSKYAHQHQKRAFEPDDDARRTLGRAIVY
jgi:hypothetical protein